MPLDPKRWSPRERALTLKDVVDAVSSRLPWLAGRVGPEGGVEFEGTPNLGDVIIWKILNQIEEAGTDEALLDGLVDSIRNDIAELRAAERGLTDLALEIAARRERRPRR